MALQLTTGTTPKSMGYDDKPFLIGADNDNGVEGTVPFHGLIDEASIYSRALSANEILTVFIVLEVMENVRLAHPVLFVN
ncbi:MAG: hypothetical protein IPK58_10570 [Acidobacteria bacterium]|nr:hypothetical protein [Acidobacteriota bacterium]